MEMNGCSFVFLNKMAPVHLLDRCGYYTHRIGGQTIPETAESLLDLHVDAKCGPGAAHLAAANVEYSSFNFNSELTMNRTLD